MANEHRRITKIFKRGRLPAAYFSTAATMALSYGSYCTPKGRRRSERESARMRRELPGVHSLLDLQDEFFQVRILPFVPPYVHLCMRLRLVSKSWHETFTEWATHATADYMRMKKPMNFYVKEWRYYFPALTSLDLSGCYFICDKELKLCACYLGWHLSELSVHGCKKLGSGGMLTVSECCANLKSLDVGCSSVSVWSVKRVVQACRSNLNASVFCWRRSALHKKGDFVLTENTGLFVMPEHRSIDIDTELDFQIVTHLMTRGDSLLDA